MSNIILFYLLFLLSGCGGSVVVQLVHAGNENNIIKELNSKCIRREGVECLILGKYAGGLFYGGIRGSRYVGEIAVAQNSLFIMDRRRVVHFDLRKKKAAILVGSNNWRLLPNPKDGYGQKAEFDILTGMALIGDTLYLTENHNPYLRRVDIGNGRTSTERIRFPNKQAPSFSRIISYGSSLYFIDNIDKRIIKLDISTRHTISIPVFAKDSSFYINSLSVVENFIYFIAYDSNNNCLFMRLDMKDGQTDLIFRPYVIKTMFTDMKRLPPKGESLIIVAVGADGDIHFRIFDKEGRMVLDKAERDVQGKSQEFETLRRHLGQKAHGDDMTLEIADSVKLITGFPQLEHPVMSQECFEYPSIYIFSRRNLYVTGNRRNIYFDDACLNIRRFNIKTGNLDLLARKPRFVNTIEGMVVLGEYLYIADRFLYTDSLLVRRVSVKDGQTSYLAGSWEN